MYENSSTNSTQRKDKFLHSPIVITRTKRKQPKNRILTSHESKVHLNSDLNGCFKHVVSKRAHVNENIKSIYNPKTSHKSRMLSLNTSHTTTKKSLNRSVHEKEDVVVTTDAHNNDYMSNTLVSDSVSKSLYAKIDNKIKKFKNYANRSIKNNKSFNSDYCNSLATNTKFFL